MPLVSPNLLVKLSEGTISRKLEARRVICTGQRGKRSARLQKYEVRSALSNSR